MAVAGVAAFQHAMTFAWIGDDMSYRFVYDTLRPIRTLGDVFASQAVHVMNENGRFPAHIFVQTFEGVWGRAVFSVANALVLVAVLMMTVRLISVAPRLEWMHRRPIVYVAVTILMMVFFPMPSQMYYSVSMSLNYLWACGLFLVMLLIFKRADDAETGRQRKALAAAGIAAAFLCGWWNEAFSVPASGGLLLYWMIRRGLSGRQKCIIVALIMGTALLAFAPGTLMRAARMGAQGGVKGSLMMLMDCYLDVTFIWILFFVAITVLVTPMRGYIRIFIKENLLTLCILAAAVVFSLYAHTYSHSLFLVEFLSMVVLMRIIGMICANMDFPVALGRTSAIVLLAVFAGFEWYVGMWDERAYADYKEMEARYENSDDGVTWLETPRPCWWPANECVADNGRQLPLPDAYWSKDFAAYHGDSGKPTVVLSPTDYRIFRNLESGVTWGKPVPGSAMAYEGDDFYLVMVSPGDEGREYVAYFDDDSFIENMSPARKVIYRLKGVKKDPKKLEHIEFSGDGYRIDIITKLLSRPSRIERG